jgi:hypothetical protein
MFVYFNKETLFTFSDIPNKKVIVNKNRLILPYLANFLSEMQFFTYIVNLSQCNNVVYISDYCHYHILLKKLFPQLNFYYNESDLSILKNDNIPFIIINNNDDLVYQKYLVEKYEPYAALLNLNCNLHTLKYLDGDIYRKIFDNGFNLIIRGIGYREWNIDNLKNNIIKDNIKYKNPISNDNKKIFKQRGLYNNFDETAMVIIIKDYFKKINKEPNYDNVIKLLIYILDNLYIDKKINLDIERIIN